MKSEGIELPPMQYITTSSNKSTGTYFICSIPTPGGKNITFTRAYKPENKSQRLLEIRARRDAALKDVWGSMLGELIANGRKPRIRDAALRNDSKTGKTGVSPYRNNKGELLGFVASWLDEGKQRYATFNKSNFAPATYQEAFYQAAKHRDTMLGDPVLSRKAYLSLFRQECLAG